MQRPFRNEKLNNEGDSGANGGGGASGGGGGVNGSDAN